MEFAPQPMNYFDWLVISAISAVVVTVTHLAWYMFVRPLLEEHYDLPPVDEDTRMPFYLGAAVGLALASFTGFIWLISILGSLFHG